MDHNRELILTLANATHIAIMNFMRTIGRLDPEFIDSYEIAELSDTVEAIREVRNKLYTREEIEANADSMLHGRKKEYFKKHEVQPCEEQTMVKLPLRKNDCAAGNPE